MVHVETLIDVNSLEYLHSVALSVILVISSGIGLNPKRRITLTISSLAIRPICSLSAASKASLYTAGDIRENIDVVCVNIAAKGGLLSGKYGVFF